MSLSPEQLIELRELEATYGANDATQLKNGTKTTIKLIGPTGVGKTTIGDKVVEIKPEEFYQVASITDRKRKPGDPAQYLTAEDGITQEGLYQEAMDGTLVNFAVNTNGHIYATRPESFEGRFNIFPLLPQSIGQIDRGGFVRSPNVYLYAPPTDYEDNLTLGGRLSYEDIKPRGREAVASLEWAQANKDKLIFVENVHGEYGKIMAAQAVIAIAYDYPIEQDHDQIAEDLEGMLAIARDLAK